MRKIPLVICATVWGLVSFAAAGWAQTTNTKTPEQQDADNIVDLVLANHIMADQGVVDGFGHVSVRSVKNPTHYFI